MLFIFEPADINELLFVIVIEYEILPLEAVNDSIALAFLDRSQPARLMYAFNYFYDFHIVALLNG